MMLENYDPFRAVMVIENLHHGSKHNTIVACRGRKTMGSRRGDVESPRKPMSATFSSWRSWKIGSLTVHSGYDLGRCT
jgi:hypothetical protein